MFTLVDNEDGFSVIHNERQHPIATVTTKTVRYSEHLDGDPAKPRLATMQRCEKTLPPEQWRIHFTGYKFAPAEILAFAEAVAEKAK
jgi:hypothetical protein